jgi:membrane-bound lytic murein transglycosylase D
MQKSLYRKLTKSNFGLYRLFASMIACITSLIILSFIPEKSPKNNPSNSTTEGEKDTIKGFRTLLGNDIIANNTTVLFELNPRVTSFVNDYLKKQSSNLEKMKTWGQPYFLIYDRILAAYNIPVELKYLSVIESDLQSACTSWAGAVGPWQLMPDEAKRFGLKFTSRYDERMDFYKSTEAASKLLKELYNEYNDWLLVIAAYNCGKSGMNRAIQKSGSHNFYDLQMYLPQETRNHVKKYIATNYYFEGGCGWTTLSADETKKKKETVAYLQSKFDSKISDANTTTFAITGKYNSVVVANTLMLDINQFNNLNPFFDKALLEGKTYAIKLPGDKMELFKAKRQQILYESVQLLLSQNAPPNTSITTAVTTVK